jgi:hypothetical protein
MCVVPLLVLAAGILSAQFGPPPDFTGLWKLESQSADAKTETLLDLKMSGSTLNGKLKTPHGDFPLENGSVDGLDIFFNVTIERDEYKLKTTYRGHLFDKEIQFTIEAGERTLQVIGRRAPKG